MHKYIFFFFDIIKTNKRRNTMATLKFKDINKIYDNKVQAVFDFN